MSTAVCLEQMVERVASVDVDSLGAREAEEVMADAVKLANAANALAARAARRVGATNAFRRTGDRTEAHAFARVSGATVAAARSSLDTLARLGSLAATAAAVRTGRLSPRQAAAVSGAAIVDPSAEQRLLRMAKAAWPRPGRRGMRSCPCRRRAC